jgi:hypothetical protein
MLISHHKKDVSLLNDIDNILGRKWIGTIDIRDSPLYNLKNYINMMWTEIVDFIRIGGKSSETVLLIMFQNGQLELQYLALY